MKIEKIEIDKLQPAEYNPRQITTKQYKDLKESIEKFSLCDPIIINQNGNVVVGGHQRLKVCKELKYNKVDCVILDLTKEEERELNIRLNKSGGEWDFDLLSNFEIEELKDWGFKEIELGLNIDKIDENPYTHKIEAPTYEAADKKPNITDLSNCEKTNELIEKIKESNVSKNEKDFLIKAAQRHMVFDYSKIADYYANSNKELQELMEDSALVIIDFNKAIENGYIKLTKEVEESYLKDYGE